MKVVNEKYYELGHEYDRDYRVEFYTTSKEVAEQWKAKSCYNSAYLKETTKIFLDKFEDIAEAETAKKRQAALAKLTESERKLLGLE